MAKKRFYNYLYSYPQGFADLSGIVFYVGKGTGKRCDDHIREAKTQCECAKCQAIRKVWATGLQVQIDIVNETDCEQDSLWSEQELIIRHRSAHLTNVASNPDAKAFAHTSTKDVLISKLLVKHPVDPGVAIWLTVAYGLDGEIYCDLQNAAKFSGIHINAFLYHAGAFSLEPAFTGIPPFYRLSDLKAFQVKFCKQYPNIDARYRCDSH